MNSYFIRRNEQRDMIFTWARVSLHTVKMIYSTAIAALRLLLWDGVQDHFSGMSVVNQLNEQTNYVSRVQFGIIDFENKLKTYQK